MSKRDPALEDEAQDWIERTVGETFTADYVTALKDGVLLCKYATPRSPCP